MGFSGLGILQNPDIAAGMATAAQILTNPLDALGYMPGIPGGVRPIGQREHGHTEPETALGGFFLEQTTGRENAAFHALEPRFLANQRDTC